MSDVSEYNVIDLRGHPIWWVGEANNLLCLKDNSGHICGTEEARRILPLLVRFYEELGSLSIEAYNRDLDIGQAAEEERLQTLGRAKPASDIPGRVYLLYCKARDLYKIGITTTPLETRLRSIAADIGADVILIGAIEAEHPRATERVWHNRFWKKHRGREWFDLSPEDVKEFLDAEGQVAP